jgi:hypothetical protein
MTQMLSLLTVAVMAGVFLLISYYRKRRMHPLCDRFAGRFCELADGVLPHLECGASLLVEPAGEGALRMRPPVQQPEEIRAVLGHPVGEDDLEALRDLYFLRHEIQSHASNGSLAKDKYNAITNQLFDSVNTFLAIINHPEATFSQKDLDNFHYFLQKQKHIRNVTLPSIVSKTCGSAIFVS